MSDKCKHPIPGTKEYEEETQKIAREFLESVRKRGPSKLDERGVIVGNVKTLTATDEELFPDEPEEHNK